MQPDPRLAAPGRTWRDYYYSLWGQLSLVNTLENLSGIARVLVSKYHFLGIASHFTV